MALILNIETSSTTCSVALAQNGQVMALRKSEEGYSHAENLHPFIGGVLNDAGKKTRELDAVAVSRGPGSYTGLRIGVSAAKGMAYALDKPLIAVDTLQLMSLAARGMQPGLEHFCPMIDARRMEVFTAVYNAQLIPLWPAEALIVNESSIGRYGDLKNLAFFGDGMPKCKPLFENHGTFIFIDDIKPSAELMAPLSLKRFEDRQFENVAYFEPFYLKDYYMKTGSGT